MLSGDTSISVSRCVKLQNCFSGCATKVDLGPCNNATESIFMAFCLF